MKEKCRWLFIWLLLCSLTTSVVLAGNLGGTYINIKGSEGVFQDQPSLEKVLTTHLHDLKQLVISSGEILDSDWDWLCSQTAANAFAELEEFRVESTMKSVASLKAGWHSGKGWLRFPALKKCKIAKVKKVGEAFLEANQLEELYLPDVEIIEKYVFNSFFVVTGNGLASKLNKLSTPQLKKIEENNIIESSLFKTWELGAVPPSVAHEDAIKWKEKLDNAKLQFVKADGTSLQGEALQQVQKVYKEVADGTLNDPYWYGFLIEDGVQFYEVKLEIDRSVVLAAVTSEEQKQKINNECVISLRPSAKVMEGDQVCLDIKTSHGTMLDPTSLRAQQLKTPAEEVKIDPKTNCFRMPAADVKISAKYLPNTLKMKFYTVSKEDGKKAETEFSGRDMSDIMHKISAEIVKVIKDKQKDAKFHEYWRTEVKKIEILEGSLDGSDYDVLHPIYLQYITGDLIEQGRSNGFIALESFVVSDNVRSNDYTVTGSKLATSLREAYLAHLLKAGENAFSSLKFLETITLPHLQSLGEHALADNEVLKSVVAPHLEEIKESVFKNCRKLTRLSFPHLQVIGKKAFENCESLASLYLGMNPPSVGANCFDALPSNRVLFLVDADGKLLEGEAKKAAIERYRAAEDGNTQDDLWYGWRISKGALYKITIDAETLKEGDVFVPEYAEGGTTLIVRALAKNGGVTESLEYKEEGSEQWIKVQGVSFVMPEKNITLRVKFGQKQLFITVNGGAPLHGKDLIDALKKGGFDVENSNEATADAAIAKIKKLAIVGGTIDVEDWTQLISNKLNLLTALVEFSIVGDVQVAELEENLQSPRQYFTDCHAKKIRIEHIRKLPLNAFKDAEHVEEIDCPDLTILGKSVFEGCKNLKVVKLPKLLEIDLAEFKNCTSLESLDCKLPNTYPSELFMGCTSLKNIPQADEVISIGVSTFEGCKALELVECPAVRSIDQKAFAGCKNLKSVRLAKVEGLGIETFVDCSGLRRVEFPLLTEGGERAFANCTKLSEVLLPKLQKVDGNMFEGCSGIQTLTLPSCSEFVAKALDGAPNVKELHLPALEDLEENAFDGLSKLEILVAENVKTIGSNAFKGCTSLKSLRFPNLEKIESEAFAGCSALVSLVAPRLNELQEQAFKECESLQRVEFPGTEREYEYFNSASEQVKTKIVAPLVPENAQPFFGLTQMPELVLLHHENGTVLAGEALTKAAQAYKAVDDGNKNDNLWYGLTIPFEQKLTKVTFQVSMNKPGQMVEGALVTVATKGAQTVEVGQITTNTAGECSLSLKKGVYIYTIREAHCKQYSGEFTIENESPTMVQVQLTQMALISYEPAVNGDLIVKRGSASGEDIASGTMVEMTDEIFIKATEHANYKLNYLLVNAQNYNEKAQTGFTLKAGTGLKIEVSFSSENTPKKKYKLTYTAPQNGRLNVECGSSLLDGNNNEITEGDVLKITLTPDANYSLFSIKNGEEELKEHSSTDANNITKLQLTVRGNVNLVAVFSKKCSVKIAPVSHGTLEIYVGANRLQDNPSFVASNTELTLKVEADADYLLTSLQGIVGTEPVIFDVSDPTKTEYKYTVSSDIEFKAEFQAMYPVTFAQPEHSKLVVMVGNKPIATGDKFVAGTEIQIEAKALEGYKIASLMVAGEEKKDALIDSKLVFQLSKDTEIKLKVEKETSVDDSILASVLVAPNPFVGEVYLTNVAEVAKVTLVNTQGVVVRTVYPKGVNNLVFMTQDLPSGVYLVVLERSETRKSIRLVK